MEIKMHQFPRCHYCDKILESNHQVNIQKMKLYPQSIK